MGYKKWKNKVWCVNQRHYNSPMTRVAHWIYARLISEGPQKQVQSLSDALLRSIKQAPIDGNGLSWPSVKGVPSNLHGIMG